MNFKLAKAIEYIHRNGLSNGRWSVYLESYQSKPLYGTYFDILLPPHLAIWEDAKNLPEELITSSPDYFLITQNGDWGLFIWTFSKQ